MKHKGSKCDFIAKRNQELIQAYRNAISTAETIDLDDVITTAINTPCSRFWVSPERASIVISKMEKNIPLEKMIPTRKEMYDEIYRRYCDLKPHGDIPQLHIVERIVEQSAPKFYLTIGSGKAIISKIKKDLCKEMKSKLRHCFM